MPHIYIIMTRSLFMIEKNYLWHNSPYICVD